MPSHLSAVALRNLSVCERLRTCVFSVGQVDRLFSAFMDNEKSHNNIYRVAFILEEMAFRAAGETDIAQAAKLIREAIQINPGPAQYRLSAASIMLLSNQPKEATIYVEQVLSEPQPHSIKTRAEKIKQDIENGYEGLD
ncbi:MAG: hypothetical protein GY806_01975 [Gammaproteobacteria bacterium]|nr:hypothetical protein [Gammaproteobacteria bacterium]